VTLLEVAVASALLAGMMVMLGAALMAVAAVLGRATDDEMTFLRGVSALVRIRDELESAVQAPQGVTALPAYSVSASAVTFRQPVGVISTSDPSYPAMVAAGLVSRGGLLYAPYAKTIAYDAASRRVTLSATGTLPAGMPAVTVLAEDVAEFAFFDGESHASPPAAPTSESWVIGCRIVIRRPSAAPAERGAEADSSMGGAVLTIKANVAPETLINKRSKPGVSG
jgi:hypothetical protein